MRPIDKIIIHCSATRPNMDWGAREIRKVHVEQNGWADIGYHYIIKRDGVLEEGRPLENIGAHTRGFNKGSIGICLIGGVDDNLKPEANFTADQSDSLKFVITLLIDNVNSDLTLHGHRDFDNGKACPSFDVAHWWNTGEFKL